MPQARARLSALIVKLGGMPLATDHSTKPMPGSSTLTNRNVVFNNGLRNACQTNQINERNSTMVLRKVQKPAPGPEAIESAVAACKQLSAMIRKGIAGEAHVRIREQLEARLAEI